MERRTPAERARYHLPLWRPLKWLVSAAALIGFVALILNMRHAPVPGALTGAEFAELAVTAHRQYIQGELALDIRSNSQQVLNQWLKAKSPFRLSLPLSPARPGEEGPNRPQGARLIEIGGNSAAFLAYDMENPRLQKASAASAIASLMVVPVSVAQANGGVELRFTKVSFHYATVRGYKVVTWSVHGLTYALVSGEGNHTQRSCMVCHSAMRDRDLSATPTPLLSQKKNAPGPAPQ